MTAPVPSRERSHFWSWVAVLLLLTVGLAFVGAAWGIPGLDWGGLLIIAIPVSAFVLSAMATVAFIRSHWPNWMTARRLYLPADLGKRLGRADGAAQDGTQKLPWAAYPCCAINILEQGVRVSMSAIGVLPNLYLPWEVLRLEDVAPRRGLFSRWAVWSDDGGHAAVIAVEGTSLVLVLDEDEIETLADTGRCELAVQALELIKAAQSD